MRLVIDCFKLIKGTGKSIGIYNVAQSIVNHLGKLNVDRKEDIFVLGNSKNQEDFDVPGVSFIRIDKYDPTRKIHLLLWELIYVSLECKKLNADKVFFPRGYTALTHPVYDIVLIHDLIPFYYNKYFPGYFGRVENAYFMRRLKQSSRSACKIITISHSSKNAIVKYCGVRPERIEIIYNGCDRITAETQKSGEPYICAMTSHLPHKNALGVIEAYIKYCESVANPINLTIIGLDNINDYIIKEDIRKKIKCIGFIKSNYDMYKIIGGSSVFLFLSLVEGFGLPPIEAMYLRVPVICSNISSLPEIVGNAAILVDPFNYDQISSELINLLQDSERYQMLVEMGVKNTERFSWDSIIQQYWHSLFEI